jgi:citrate lyase gamma subunit
MTMSRVYSDGRVEIPIQQSETGKLAISALQLSSLFEEGTATLQIMCHVSNQFGSDSMTTVIKVCGTLNVFHKIKFCFAYNIIIIPTPTLLQ